jgi:hypothetical protein
MADHRTTPSRLGSTSNRTGTNDPNILRAVSLYRSYINRPWLLGLGEQY